METAPYFSSVHDPRVVGRCKHKLSDILMVALITYLCGGEDYSDMYQLCRFRGKEFKPLLELPNGCPSEDTFERVMQAVHPDEIAACLEVYTSQIIKDLSGMHIAIDGKKMRGTNPRGHGESSYILSAWVNEHSLSIAQEAVGEKTNEITCVPKLLDKLALEGAIVTMDAMGTQVEIAEQVVKKKADFVLALKGNQRHLFEDTTDAFSTRQPHKRHLEQEKGHGRIDKRSYKVLPAEGNLTDEVARRWPMVRSLVRVEHEVTKPNAQPTKETRYYISSLDFNEASAKEIAYYIREHWGIENRLHWQLDVTFREDACRARKNFSARNLNLIRKFSLAILRQQHDTLSLKARRWKCSLRIDYLKQVLGF